VGQGVRNLADARREFDYAFNKLILSLG
jgi:hypothetical protein